MERLSCAGLWGIASCLLGACTAANVSAPLDGSNALPRHAAQPRPPSKPTLRVLFIGNSFTYVNELPSVLASLASDVTSPVALTVAEHASGGATWEDHDRDATIEPLLQQGWDWVVLQDQSQQPWLYHGGIKPALRSLDAKIKAAGAKTMLFMTWARRVQSDLSSAQRFEEDMAINNYYERHAAAVGAEVAPVGRAWERALRDPTVSLHGDDGIHPNERGTYLAACVFYAELIHRSPLGLGSGGLGVTPAERTLLQQTAWDMHNARQRGNDVVPFPGPAGYAAIPYFPGMNAMHFTAALHAYRADWSVPPPNGYEALLEKNWGYGVWQNQDSVEARLYTVNQSATLSYSVLGLTPGWHHFAMTYDGSHYALWIDAIEVASGTATGDLAFSNWLGPDVGGGAGADYPFNAVALGVNTVDTALGGASIALFTGFLADVRLFDRALSQLEIRDAQERR